jgi:hypothetical protein
MTRPAQYPDIEYFLEDLPISWTVTVGSRVGTPPVWTPADLSDSELSAPVFDGGVAVGAFALDRTNDATGVIRVTFDSSIGSLVTSYAQWRFREDTTWNQALVAGRLVRL